MTYDSIESTSLPHADHALKASFDMVQSGRSLMWSIQPSAIAAAGQSAGDIHLLPGTRISVQLTGYADVDSNLRPGDLQLQQVSLITVPNRRVPELQYGPTPFVNLGPEKLAVVDLHTTPGFSEPVYSSTVSIGGMSRARWIFAAKATLDIDPDLGSGGYWEVSLIVTAELKGSRRVFRFDPEIEVGNGSHPADPQGIDYLHRIR